MDLWQHVKENPADSAILGADSPLPRENEISVPGPIPDRVRAVTWEATVPGIRADRWRASGAGEG